MSRSGYSDDCENLELYRNAVERALRGKRGQKFLREMAIALDAMPEKILIEDQLEDAQGNICALGAVFKARGVPMNKIEYYDPDSVAGVAGVARSMAAEIEYMNDEWRPDETPAQRWIRMRQWVQAQIVEEKPEQENDNRKSI